MSASAGNIIIPDASVLLKWGLDTLAEDDREQAALLQDEWLDGRVDLEVSQVDRGNPELLGKSLGDVVLRYRAQADQRLAEFPALVALRLQCGIDLLGRDELRLHEEIAQFYDH